MNSKLGKTTEQEPISKKIKNHKMEVKHSGSLRAGRFGGDGAEEANCNQNVKGLELIMQAEV